MRILNVTDDERFAAFCALFSGAWKGSDDELIAREEAATAINSEGWEELLDGAGNLRAFPTLTSAVREIVLTGAARDCLLKLMREHPTHAKFGRAKTRLLVKLRDAKEERPA